MLDVTSDAVDTEAPGIGIKGDGAEDVAAVDDGEERERTWHRSGTRYLCYGLCGLELPKPLCS